MQANAACYQFHFILPVHVRMRVNTTRKILSTCNSHTWVIGDSSKDIRKFLDIPSIFQIQHSRVLDVKWRQYFFSIWSSDLNSINHCRYQQHYLPFKCPYTITKGASSHLFHISRWRWCSQTWLLPPTCHDLVDFIVRCSIEVHTNRLSLMIFHPVKLTFLESLSKLQCLSVQGCVRYILSLISFSTIHTRHTWV